MNILDEIVAVKREELLAEKTKEKQSKYEKHALTKRTKRSLAESLNGSQCGIIAEFKRRSPSKPSINLTATVKDVAKDYADNGASGMSILTNQTYFGGQNEDVQKARQIIDLPILRKEFIIDAFQILEAAYLGADAILLIASVLNKEEVRQFSSLAHDLNLEVLLEIHDKRELDKYDDQVDILGVNNRNLKLFKTDYKHSIDIYKELPKGKTLISESGLSEAYQLKELKDCGYNGFLIGESFMKTEAPGEALHSLIKKVIDED